MAKRRRKEDESGGNEEKQEERNPSVVPIIDGEEGDIELGESGEGKRSENEKEDSRRQASGTEAGSRGDQKKDMKVIVGSEECVKGEDEKVDDNRCLEDPTDQYLDKDNEMLR